MQPKRFEADVRYERGVAILDLRGEIDAGADEGLTAAYERAERHDPEVILLNFGSVDYINSTGIALIVGLLARARNTGRRLIASGLNDHYTRIFHITRLADYMDIFPDEADALESLQSAIGNPS